MKDKQVYYMWHWTETFHQLFFVDRKTTLAMALRTGWKDTALQYYEYKRFITNIKCFLSNEIYMYCISHEGLIIYPQVNCEICLKSAGLHEFYGLFGLFCADFSEGSSS